MLNNGKQKRENSLLWVSIILGLLAEGYFLFTVYVFGECLSFYGTPPFDWPEGRAVWTPGVLRLYVIVVFAALILRAIILGFNYRCRKKGEASGEKKIYRFILCLDAGIVVCSIVQFLRYGSWTICKLVDSNTGRFEPYIWRDAISTQGQLIIAAFVFSILLFGIGLAQCLHERKKWKYDKDE